MNLVQEVLGCVPQSLCQSSSEQISPAETRVLLVDDEDMTRMLVANFLSREGMLVSTVRSSEEALREAARWIPHVLIYQLEPDQRDGFNSLRQIRGVSDAALIVTASEASPESHR